MYSLYNSNSFTSVQNSILSYEMQRNAVLTVMAQLPVLFATAQQLQQSRLLKPAALHYVRDRHWRDPCRPSLRDNNIRGAKYLIDIQCTKYDNCGMQSDTWPYHKHLRTFESISIFIVLRIFTMNSFISCSIYYTEPKCIDLKLNKTVSIFKFVRQNIVCVCKPQRIWL